MFLAGNRCWLIQAFTIVLIFGPLTSLVKAETSKSGQTIEIGDVTCGSLLFRTTSLIISFPPLPYKRRLRYLSPASLLGLQSNRSLPTLALSGRKGCMFFPYRKPGRSITYA